MMSESQGFSTSPARNLWVEKDLTMEDPWLVMESWEDEYSGGAFYHSTWRLRREAKAEMKRLIQTGEGSPYE